MYSSMFFQISAFFYCSLIMLTYFSKKRLASRENKFFSILIITNFIGLIIDLISTYLAIISKVGFVLTFFSKLYLVYLVFWITFMTLYIITISFDGVNKEKIQKFFTKFFQGLLIISIVVIMILPLYNNTEIGKIYTYGLSADFTYLVSGIHILFWLILLPINFKKIRQKKYYPMYFYMTFGLALTFLQALRPELLVITAMETFVTSLMYFTIENPDMKMIEQLDFAKKRAEQANRAKTEFLSNMSHEIRTPLNAIVGFSQALQSEDIPESAKEEVNDIIMASNGLLEIVNGILDISKIEANKLEIINTDYSFKKVFNELVSLTKSRLGETTLEFKYSMDPTIPALLYGDHSRVKQVILNILTNAVKYTKTGYIDFKVSSVISADVCRLIISVEDTGIGIKQENVSKLFNNFERLGVEKEITIEGTGLGLAITKRLVELMQGTIVVQTIYGQGSKFTISIDQKIVSTYESEPMQETNDDVLNIIDCTGKRVLVVDDNKINLKVAERLLKDYNVTIDKCYSGQECIDKVKNGNTYDLIFMDDMMPKMSGVDAFNILNDINGFNMPVIALTANAISGMKEKYISDGFDDYLAKPIEKKELNRIIIKFLK